MKVLYFAVLDSLNEASGVQKKISHQVRSLNNAGLDIEAFLLIKENNEIILDNNELNIIDNNTNLHAVSINKKNIRELMLNKISLVAKFNNEKYCYEKMNYIINSYHNIDIIYLRNMRGSPNLLKFVKKYPNMIVFEHQSKELEEIKLRGSMLKYLLELFFKPLVYKYILGCVCVTQEIETYQKNRFKKKLLNTKVITNSFEVNSVKVRKVPVYDNLNIRLLFVGTVSYWHGIDRVIYGLKNYAGTKNIEIYIIGEGEYTQKIKNLVELLKLKESVFFEGPKNVYELDPYFDNCHIAIGSLGIHRINMHQATILKVREYLSRGIPIMLSYIDDDLERKKEIEPFLLTVPPDDSPISIDDVVKYVKETASIKDHPRIIRNFALNHIDSSVKASELHNFFSTLKGDPERCN